MKTIVLIGCSKLKLDHCATASQLYQGAVFKKSLVVARKHYPNAPVYVLSAEYGLVPIDQILCPYDETLNGKKADEIKDWSAKVIGQMKAIGIDPQNDIFIVFAGKNYRKYLPLSNATNMFDGCRGIGEILNKLNKLI